MTTHNIASVDGTVGHSSYIAGDYDPANFDYNTALSRGELLSLFLRNPKIQKATVWFANEMLRERWKFKTKQPITAPKHGIDFEFEQFNDWLEWNGFMQELLKAFMWSLLFGDSILVFYDGKEVSAKEVLLKPSKSYVKCRAYYPNTAGNGYTIKEVDPMFNIPAMYKIELHAHKASNSVTIYAPMERVVRFIAPQKELKYGGTSTVSAIAHDCLVQEQIKRAVATQANNLQGGIVALKAATEEERAIVDNAVGDTLTHLRRLYFKNTEEADQLVKLIIPDLKIDQLERLNGILQTDIATGSDISISILEGAPQGALSSAAFDTFNTYSKVKQLQSHYTHALEEAFFKLGKMDTTFEWNDPTPAPKEAVDNNITPLSGVGKEEIEDKDEEIEE